ncbi:DUF4085 family protein [Paenibacillus sp. GCM10023252]|uniref:DUF4085 family protein n=1 Tax=Paenibacillus sp. GCM10023252 TaxID=3252649 RepID=UPI00360D2A1B
MHPYIQDRSLNSQYPSDELREMADQWLSKYDEREKQKGLPIETTTISAVFY